MKLQRRSVVLGLVLAATLGLCNGTRRVLSLDGRPRAITEVVKMLQEMSAKSKVDADADREIFAKLQCYCNSNEESKTEEIVALTKDISLLESEIQALRGSTSALSSQCAKLTADLAANEAARRAAQSLRNDEASTFSATKLDLETAIGQLKEAIDALAQVGADQTLEKAASDHVKFMAGESSLLRLGASVKHALSAAEGFLKPKEANLLESFFQKPFTGVYTAQSGEVVGILKDMRDTFQSNLAEATEGEQRAITAFTAFMEAKLQAHGNMTRMFNEKQSEMGTNDDDLTTKQEQLKDAQKAKGVREAFLAEMRPMCERKTAEYKERQSLRQNEDAAIAEAIAILDRDSAFVLFGKVNATSSGLVAPGLLQTRQVRRQSSQTQDVDEGARVESLQLLQAAGTASGTGTQVSRLTRVVALLEGRSPLDAALEEIYKMLALLEREGASDVQERDWCVSERRRLRRTISAASLQIVQLRKAISALRKEIEMPQMGLLAQIRSTEEGLQDNQQSQKAETSMRAKENQAYQEDIANLVKAKELLASAIQVLTNYYEQIARYTVADEEASILPGEKEPHPSTWEAEGGYKGQSIKGTNVINMLQYILDESKKEETAAHEDEESSQRTYEEDMAGLKRGEAQFQKSLASLGQTLATKQQELLESQDDEAKTRAVRRAAKAPLKAMKAGCDFRIGTFRLREQHRSKERAALEKVESLLKATPVHQAAEAAAEIEALGPCRETCEQSREHVRCKACLASVSVPGYCAGHPGTSGC